MIDTCPDDFEPFVYKCTRRSGKSDRSAWNLNPADRWNGNNMTYDRDVNKLLPAQTLYSPPDRAGFFYRQLLVGKQTGATLDQARESWSTMVADGVISPETDELIIQFIVAAPDARCITLVTVHFSTDRIAGGISPAISIWSFGVPTRAQKKWHTFYTTLFSTLIVYLFVLELCEMFGIEIHNGHPTWHAVNRRTPSFSESVWLYWFRMSVWDFIDWLVILMSVTTIRQREYYSNNFSLALESLRASGSNAEAYAELISAQNDMMWVVYYGSMTFMIGGIRLFKYFAAHPRLGEISKTISKSSLALGHFVLVLFTLLWIYASVGHFLFAYAMPDEFGTMGRSCVAMIQMIAGEISYNSLVEAFGSSTVDYQVYAYIPVILFYFGKAARAPSASRFPNDGVVTPRNPQASFSLSSCCSSTCASKLLSVECVSVAGARTRNVPASHRFLGIILSAYDEVHAEVLQHPADDYNVFLDMKTGFEKILCRLVRCGRQQPRAAADAAAPETAQSPKARSAAEPAARGSSTSTRMSSRVHALASSGVRKRLATCPKPMTTPQP